MATAVFDRITHRYGGASVPSLRDVSITIRPGMTLVAGGSGSGKSTLLRVFNGLVPHFHGGTVGGSATVAGLPVLTTPVRELARFVGFVFQDPEAQFVGGTVEREVAFGPENLGLPPADIGRRVAEALERAGVDHLRHRSVGTLSGGERQRVAVASALAMRPKLLVLDEPTAQLDPAGVCAVVRLCLDLARAGTAVVVAEHRLDLLLPGSDAVINMAGGLVNGPTVPALAARALAAPPQVVALGVAKSWEPVPLTVAEVAGRFPRLGPLPEGLPARGEVAWSLEGVCAGPGQSPVVTGVDLDGRAGEVVVLMGPNGGGKTTLLRVIAGILKPREGRVERRPGGVAYLPQNPGVVLHRPTVRSEVEITLRRARTGGSPRDILGALGLLEFASADPADLSSGQRQRAALAALLCAGPALALLDEPTRGMDACARGQLVALVRSLAAAGAAIVLATHDSEVAAEVANRVVEVAGGAVRELGPPRRALTGRSPYATQLGTLLAGGPMTVAEALPAT